ncbi:hypothetical protein DS2_14409 [Catenovulum agarivorans DS-2]|uniref:DUF2846 domain-containing protein n=1 Tax=Catenovulum agarivorans DS-2 TaxID=1328313 RepID=W7QJF6_9ALTE|nr:hypothetical protein [Catenovulum agarivorans]EWH09072.1 hypothetical protein DS2_14409 [Catenovulum agarivorans DS-2]
MFFSRSIMYLCLLALFVSTKASAEFDLPGQAIIVYPSGLKKPVDFGFSYKMTDEGTRFSAGNSSVAVSQVPEQYTLALYLHQDQYIWVSEFSKGYFSTFVYKIGDHVIELRKAPNRNIKGKYELIIDGKISLFDTNTIQLDFAFDENGIKRIIPRGAIKNIGQMK